MGNALVRQKVIDEVIAEMNRTDENAEDTPDFYDYVADVARRFSTILGSEA